MVTRPTNKRNALPLVASLLVAATAGLPVEVLAFGGLGHRVAGLLAERELCPAARTEVAELADG
ncbi:MAG TPA: endonuclease, partial [Gammaproteobacteria bacterium]|nr:endonuclease [Gammaproteobacteria bacterium]